MALGEKLFEEIGKTTSLRVARVHPVEGTRMEVTFLSEIKGAGRVPDGQNLGSGVTTHYPHGTVDSNYHGVYTSKEGDQFMWWAHEKSRALEGGKTKGLVIVSGFTHSQKLSWMNNVVIVLDSQYDPAAQEYRGTAYEWK
jgi:hypothetical protein